MPYTQENPYRSVIWEKIDSLAVITLNRPQVLNAWHAPMRLELMEALATARDSAEIGGIVLTGAGDRAFSAGQDINESTEFDDDRAEAWIEEFRALYGLVRSIEKPVVAALNGVTAGSAFQFALLTDLRVIHEGTRMGQPEINSGIASITGPWIMREVLGLSRTIDLTLTGRMLGAEECMALGLAHRLVPRDNLMEHALAEARGLAEKPPLAMALIKRRIWEVLRPGLDECMDAAIRYHRQSYKAGEPQEVGNAFLEARGGRKAL